MSGDFGTEYGDGDSVGRRVTRVLFGGFLLTALVVGLYLSLGGTPGRSGDADTPAEPGATEPAQAGADGGAQDGGGGAEEEQDGGAGGEDGEEGPTAEELIESAPAPEDTTIQLLDGSNSDAVSDANEVLAELGYDVVAVNPGRDYAETTVFFNPGQRRAARALRARDERFGLLAPNDRGLSDEVDLHVIVGADWPD